MTFLFAYISIRVRLLRKEPFQFEGGAEVFIGKSLSSFSNSQYSQFAFEVLHPRLEQ